ELIVTVGLTITILAVGITSYITISDKQLEQSYKMVSSEITTAGAQYLNSNKYLLEMLEQDQILTVPLGTLVNEDYLNVVINPITKKEFDACSLVLITKKENGMLDYKFIEEKPDDKNDCGTVYTRPSTTTKKNTTITTTVAGAPSIKLLVLGTVGNAKWYKSDVTITPVITVKSGNVPVTTCTTKDIKTIGAKEVNCTNLNDKHELTLTNNIKGTKVCYTAGDVGKTATACVTIKIDKTAPTLEVSLKKNPYSLTGLLSSPKEDLPQGQWYNKYAYTKAKATDDTSGVDAIYYMTTGSTTSNGYIKSYYKDIRNEGTTNITYRVVDKAGNERHSTVNVNLDRTRPVCGVAEGSSSVWTNQNRIITQHCNDSFTNCNSQTREYTSDKETDVIEISDSAGNKKNCNVHVYVDKTPPVIKSPVTILSEADVYQTTDNGNFKTKLKNISCSDKLCIADLCIKNYPGTFDAKGINLTASFNISRKSSFKRISRTMRDKNGNYTQSKDCKYTDGDNPCFWYWDYKAVDNAGNETKFGISINVGYLPRKGIYDGDLFCQ
ncbi:MAG: hypothetical protein RSA10_02630, partial [Bacilli bacterium]